jgi:hypothetical protein
MEPLGEGRIANSGWALPSKWSFVCAANPPNSTYDVDVLDEALMNRLLHVPMGFDVVRWSAWAGTKNVHQDLISFTAQHPGSVAAKNPELPEEIVVKATPRTIEYLARLYEPNMDRDLLRVLAQGLIGDETAAQFLRHIDNPERAVSDDEVLNDDGFEARIIAHLSAGRDDLLDASQTLLLAMMVRHHATPESAARVALYMQAIGGKRSTEVWETMVVIAPYWQEALTKAAGDLKTSKRNAAAAGRATR